MLINCFRPSAKTAIAIDNDDRPQPARLRPSPRKTATFLRRAGTDLSSTSSNSNDSISKLPPCKRRSDAELDALMMPVPPVPDRPSNCLRLSHPKIYSGIISDMKAIRGCRNWKDFDVFPADEVDERVSAVDRARKTAAAYERKLRILESFDSGPRRSIDEVDLIG